ncbi:TetR/AcrR family transcriptional regulator C-terminal domain-containing protein, partial [Neobacillus niacini]|uniref:TetR/AcrR family transcriptional regulator n=1 Tax=Neobacillus niacini TaxID=86668 RepID=UPI0030002001
MIKNSTIKSIPNSKVAFREALLRLMNQKDFHTITISEIADLAGYQRATFYLHYNSKENLIDELISEKLQVLYQFLSIHERELKLAEYYKIFTHIYENAAFFKIMFSEKRIPGFLSQITNTLANYINKKELPSSDDNTAEIDKEFYVIYHATITIGHFLYWIQTDFKYSPEYMSKITKYFVEENPFKTFFQLELNQFPIMTFHETKEDKKMDRRILRTKKLIKDAFLELLIIKDFDLISMTDIANCADVNRSTLYAYFPNKSSLTEEIIDEMMEGLAKVIFGKFKKEEKKLIGQDDFVLSRMFKYIYDNAASFQLITGENRVPGVNQRFISEIKKIVNIILNTNKVIDPMLKSNNDITVNIMSSALVGVIGHWMKSGLVQGPSPMAKQFT